MLKNVGLFYLEVWKFRERQILSNPPVPFIHTTGENSFQWSIQACTCINIKLAYGASIHVVEETDLKEQKCWWDIHISSSYPEYTVILKTICTHLTRGGSSLLATGHWDEWTDQSGFLTLNSGRWCLDVHIVT